MWSARTSAPSPPQRHSRCERCTAPHGCQASWDHVEHEFRNRVRSGYRLCRAAKRRGGGSRSKRRRAEGEQRQRQRLLERLCWYPSSCRHARRPLRGGMRPHCHGPAADARPRPRRRRSASRRQGWDAVLRRGPKRQLPPSPEAPRCASLQTQCRSRARIVRHQRQPRGRRPCPSSRHARVRSPALWRRSHCLHWPLGGPNRRRRGRPGCTAWCARLGPVHVGERRCPPPRQPRTIGGRRAEEHQRHRHQDIGHQADHGDEQPRRRRWWCHRLQRPGTPPHATPRGQYTQRGR